MMVDHIPEFAHSWIGGQFILSFSFLNIIFLFVNFIAVSLTFSVSLLIYAFVPFRDTIKPYVTAFVSVLMFLGVNVSGVEILRQRATPEQIVKLMSPGAEVGLNSVVCFPTWPAGIKAVNKSAAMAISDANNQEFCRLDISGTVVGTFKKHGRYETFIKSDYGAIWQVPTYLVLSLFPDSTLMQAKPIAEQNTPDSGAMSNFEQYKTQNLEHHPGNGL